MTELQLLNDNVMRDLLGDDEECILDFKRQFLAQAENCLSEMQTFLAQGNFSKLKDRAHFLKTSARAIGAELSASALEVIEQQAQENNTMLCKAALIELKMLHKKLKLKIDPVS
ncbi:hypothetical protein PALB_18780 [Pseudoalteromonas luteoviolacea B = ATCC 29581]|nr:hypothetical protein PALB_18780 [Pseudoalteromonas luteoviolacea B = ATCC 29581]